MNKALAKILCILFIFLLLAPAAADSASTDFTDTQDHWSAPYALWAKEQGIMHGVTETTFAPDRLMTRAMAITVLYRLSGETATSRNLPFIDVPADSYYANAISWAIQNGLVNGVSATRFAPDKEIMRQDFAVMLHRFYQYAQTGQPVIPPEKTPTDPYTHIQTYRRNSYYLPYPYATDALDWAVLHRIITGTGAFGDGIYPFSHLTRAQSAAMIKRYVEMDDTIDPQKLYDISPDDIELLRFFKDNMNNYENQEFTRIFIEQINQFEYTDIKPVSSDTDYEHTDRSGLFRWGFFAGTHDLNRIGGGRIYEEGIVSGNFLYVAADQEWYQHFIETFEKYAAA